MAQLSGWCAPTVIYIVLAVLNVLLLGKMYGSLLDARVLLSAAFSAFVAVVLYMLCAAGHGSWAWFILLFPFVLSLLIYALTPRPTSVRVYVL